MRVTRFFNLIAIAFVIRSWTLEVVQGVRFSIRVTYLTIRLSHWKNWTWKYFGNIVVKKVGKSNFHSFVQFHSVEMFTRYDGSALLRLKRLVPHNTTIRLYKAHVVPHSPLLLGIGKYLVINLNLSIALPFKNTA